MEKFYCIKLIEKYGKRGYVINTQEPGVRISTDATLQQVMKFNSFTDANLFIKRNKLQNNKIKAYVRDNDDFVKDEKAPKVTILSSDLHLKKNNEKDI